MKKDVTPLTPLESKAPKLSKPKNSAAGIPAVISTAKYGLGNMGVLGSIKNLARVNAVSYTHLALPTTPYV